VSIEERIPASQPLRRIRKLADQALDRLNPTFYELYAVEGRPSVAPEQLLLHEQGMGRVLEQLMGAPELKALLRDEPFSVDRTLTCSRWAPGSETLPTPWRLTSLSGAPLALRR
jgi:hypothetical protein